VKCQRKVDRKPIHVGPKFGSHTAITFPKIECLSHQQEANVNIIMVVGSKDIVEKFSQASVLAGKQRAKYLAASTVAPDSVPK
jgi:hypothetical protein